jgi:hypothetical protein
MRTAPASSLDAAISHVWEEEALKATYGLENASVKLWTDDGDWKILMRSGPHFAWTRCWKLADLHLQIYCLQRWVDELAARLQSERSHAQMHPTSSPHA